jgi:hypothetical protein
MGGENQAHQDMTLRKIVTTKHAILIYNHSLQNY